MAVYGGMDCCGCLACTSAVGVAAGIADEGGVMYDTSAVGVHVAGKAVVVLVLRHRAKRAYDNFILVVAGVAVELDGEKIGTSLDFCVN
jgi:hypothetical protein